MEDRSHHDPLHVALTSIEPPAGSAERVIGAAGARARGIRRRRRVGAVGGGALALAIAAGIVTNLPDASQAQELAPAGQGALATAPANSPVPPSRPAPTDGVTSTPSPSTPLSKSELIRRSIRSQDDGSPTRFCGALRRAQGPDDRSIVCVAKEGEVPIWMTTNAYPVSEEKQAIGMGALFRRSPQLPDTAVDPAGMPGDMLRGNVMIGGGEQSPLMGGFFSDDGENRSRTGPRALATSDQRYDSRAALLVPPTGDAQIPGLEISTARWAAGTDVLGLVRSRALPFLPPRANLVGSSVEQAWPGRSGSSAALWRITSRDGDVWYAGLVVVGDVTVGVSASGMDEATSKKLVLAYGGAAATKAQAQR